MTVAVLLIVIYSLNVVLKAPSNSNIPNNNCKKLDSDPLRIIVATRLYLGIRFPDGLLPVGYRMQTVGCVICEEEV